MPLYEMSRAEIEAFLRERRVMRVAFRAGGRGYLIPLGYAWRDGALWGTATRGRKTRMAEEDPRVVFQVDDTPDSGLWEWTSVTGEGTFELVTDGAEAERVAELLRERYADMPGWLAAELEEGRARGETVAFRILPDRLEGRRSAPAGAGPEEPLEGREEA